MLFLVGKIWVLFYYLYFLLLFHSSILLEEFNKNVWFYKNNSHSFLLSKELHKISPQCSAIISRDRAAEILAVSWQSWLTKEVGLGLGFSYLLYILLISAIKLVTISSRPIVFLAPKAGPTNSQEEDSCLLVMSASWSFVLLFPCCALPFCVYAVSASSLLAFFPLLSALSLVLCTIALTTVFPFWTLSSILSFMGWGDSLYSYFFN